MARKASEECSHCAGPTPDGYWTVLRVGEKVPTVYLFADYRHGGNETDIGLRFQSHDRMINIPWHNIDTWESVFNSEQHLHELYVWQGQCDHEWEGRPPGTNGPFDQGKEEQCTKCGLHMHSLGLLAEYLGEADG